MRFNKASATHLGLVLFLCLLFSGCEDTITGPTTQGDANPTPTPGASTGGSNQMTVTVNGSECSGSQYANEPCVAVTICQTSSSNCQTIDNILLDTGSYGLRIYGSLITIPLTSVNISGRTLAECVGYGDGSSDWGPVQMASVKLGGEAAVQLPIQSIQSTFATPPSQCTSSQSTPDTGPDETGFNGILGVGFYAQDCGSYCTTTASNQQYYTCSGSTCTESTASLSDQLTNPISLFPIDNNGLILNFPSVGVAGAASVTGTMTFGIGTASNNAVGSGRTVLGADSNGEFKSVFSAFSSSSIPAFIDSGSSLYFLPPPTGGQLPDCNTAAGGNHGSNYSGIYCPASNVSLSTTAMSGTTSASTTVSFQIGNGFNQLNSTTNAVFPAVGGESSTGTSAYFDFGLPFFFGRSIYVQIENAHSSLGTGPLWAF